MGNLERNFEQAQYDDGGTNGRRLPFPENGYANLEVMERIDSLVEAAKKDAIERTNGTPEAILRVTNAIERRFIPYVYENEIIALQISSPEYEESVRNVNDYIQGRIAAVVCDDGRITSEQIGGPREISISRRLQGLPKVRWSTKLKDKIIIKDPDIVASLKNYIDDRKEIGNLDPIIIEFLGPHIFSTDPLHGCGKEKAKIEAGLGTAEVNMWDGGINDYFDELGEGFEAFNNHIELLNGNGVTFDTTHDAYSQGLIFGLRDTRHKFDREKPLRENLIDLAHNGEILMTELLDRKFRQQIRDMAGDLGVHDYIDLNNYEQFGKNQILISQIALEIAKQEEAGGFDWIPSKLIEGKDERAVRALGYTALRNVVRRVMGNIKLGEHDLQEHPEQVVRVGAIGADFNINAIPFIHHVRSNLLSSEDIDDVQTLAGLLYASLKNFHHTDFREEGRILITTGIVEKNMHRSQKEQVNSWVGENAASIRDKYAKAVANGEIVVIAALHESKTRSMTDIVK